MRRVMLFALLALALPTAALASSINFSSGTFHNGTISRTVSGGLGVGGSTFNVHVVGDINNIALTLATLSAGCNVAGDGSCTFTGGTVTVRSVPTGTTVFTDSLVSGTITKTSTSATITGSLTPNMNGIGPAGGVARFVVQLSNSPISTTLDGGTAHVAAVPEPGTLSLLGTGLIGLAGVARRKFKLWT